MNPGNQHSYVQKGNGVFLAATVTLALLASLSHADPVDWSGYDKSFDITFPGYSGTETLTDFPVLIRISAARNAFQYDKCKLANGEDLRFSDSEGNLLSSQVDSWNPNGESLVWVKVPSLNSLTTITAYYGCSAPAFVDSKDVWSNGYVGVWHMGDATLPMIDSANGGNSLTENQNGATLPGQPGLVGHAVEFDQLSTHKGCLQTTDQRYKTSGRTDFTVEFWSYQDSCDPTNLPRSVYYMREVGSGTIWQAYGIKSTSYGANGKTVVQVIRAIGKTENPSTGNSYPLRGEWTYQNFRVSDTDHFYQGLNRNPKIATGNYTGGITNDTANTTLFIGSQNSGSSAAFPGMIDEVRISSVARSDDWLNATYDTVNNANFAIYRISNDWKRYSHTFSVSFPGATNGVLTAFPVLVKISESSLRGFRYSDCLKENGSDLRFADEEGNLLDSEIETWNPSGESLIWVNVPSLSSSTAIKAYYGWESAPDVNSANVWTNGYVGVWHLGEAGSPLETSVPAASDFVTFPGNNKAPDTSGGILWAQDGIVGKAVNFEKRGIYTNNCLRAGHLDAYEGMSALTLEAWTYRDSNATANGGYVLDMVKRTGSDQPYCMRDRNGYRQVEFAFWTTNDGDKQATTLRSGTVATDAWVYQAGTYDSAITDANNAFLYIDGVSTASASGKTDPIKASGSSCILYLGNNQQFFGFTAPFPGLIDEVRISNVARSAGWLSTTYDMIKGNANFAIYSSAHENSSGTLLLFK